MAQRSSHVPKFGSWDKDNIPYTTYFENARKEKSGERMNPNDPEENPEAFMYGVGGQESDNKSISAEKQQSEGHMRHDAVRRNTIHHQKSGTSGSSSDKSNSDHSTMQPGHRRLKSDRKKGLAEESNNSTSSSVARHSRQKSGSYTSDSFYRRAASVPKFGAWDETDPRSGEGFTVIFNKVKEEKQITSSQFPTMPPTPINYGSDNQRKVGSPSSRSKICCCLFSRRSE